MKRITGVFIIGVLLVTVAIFSPLIIREFPTPDITFQPISHTILPPFDYHVKKDNEAIKANADAALKGVYQVGTPSVDFPAITADLTSLWHDRSLASSNSHELYIHSLFIVWDLFFAHQQTKDAAYLAKAKEIITSWITHNNRWRPTTSTYIWNDHAVSERTIALLYFWDYITDLGQSDTEFDHLMNRYLRQTTAYLVNPQNYIIHHNHGIFEDIALLLLSYHMSSTQDAEKYAAISQRRFEQQIDFAFSEHAIHLENSPGYHFVVTDLAQFFIDVAHIRNIAIPQIQAKVAIAQQNKGLLLMPDGTLPPVGDTNPDDKIADVSRLTNMVLADSLAGYFIASLEDQYLLARSTSISQVHLHDDPLSFIYAVPEGILIDETGFLSYENTPSRTYTKTYQAHNGIYPSGQGTDYTRQAFIRSYGHTYASATATLQMQTRFGPIVRQLIINDASDELIVLDTPKNTSIPEWISHIQLSNALDSITQIDSTLVQVTMNKSSWFISSSSPMQLVTAQQNPLLGWKAETLGTLHPATTIVRTLANNQTSWLRITNAMPQTQTPDFGNEISQTVYQRAEAVSIRKKTLWGTQYARRVEIWQKLMALLGLSLAGILALFAIPLLRRFCFWVAFLPNIAALGAVLYVILRHIN